MKRLIAIGECMIEMSGAGDDLWRLGIAGDTLNTAWYARAALSPDHWNVAYGTVIGADSFSARVPTFLTENGIEVDRIDEHPQRSIGLYAISLKDGERSFSYWRDTSAAKTLADDSAALAAMTDRVDAVHISGITLAILPPEGRARLIHRLAELRAKGVTTVLDPNIRPRLWEDATTAARTITAAARACDIVLPSFDDEAACFGDTAPEVTLERYASLGATTVIVKNGGGAIHLLANGNRLVVDGLAQVSPIDTTGAGDSFNGAFLAAVLQGQSVLAAVHAGHAMASRVVQHRGALIPMRDLRV